MLAYIDESKAGEIKVGEPAEIVLRSHPGPRLKGKVARIEPESDRVNEERSIEVAFDHIPAYANLGEQAEVYITTVHLPQPCWCRRRRSSGSARISGTVWTVEDGHLQQREVTLGHRLLDGRYEITGGVPKGAKVVTQLRSGLRVGRAPIAQDRQRAEAMNLAYRDIKHNLLRFVLTNFGLSLLLGMVIIITGVYGGLIDDALRQARAANADLWVVQAGTNGPFAEASRIPGDTRELVTRVYGVQTAGSVTYQSVQTRSTASRFGSLSSATNWAGRAARKSLSADAISCATIMKWSLTAPLASKSAKRCRWERTVTIDRRRSDPQQRHIVRRSRGLCHSARCARAAVRACASSRTAGGRARRSD